MNSSFEAAFRRLQIRCRKPVEHLLSGEFRSIFKGRGIEFEELREYQAGDDVRVIDWRSMARTGRPHIRRFIEEREQSIVIAVDLSASASVGTGKKTKREAAEEITALLAYSAGLNKDRVGLLLFTDQVEYFIPPSRGRNHIQRLLSALIQFTPQNKGTSISQALDYIGRVSRKPGIVFLISDFLADDYEQSLRILSQRHDLTAVLLRDPGEVQLPAEGLIEMRDSESGRYQLVEAQPTHQMNREPFLRFCKICNDYDIDHFEVNPQGDCVESLSNYFHSRRRKVLNESGG